MVFITTAAITNIGKNLNKLRVGIPIKDLVFLHTEPDVFELDSHLADFFIH